MKTSTSKASKKGCKMTKVSKRVNMAARIPQKQEMECLGGQEVKVLATQLQRPWFSFGRVLLLQVVHSATHC